WSTYLPVTYKQIITRSEIYRVSTSEPNVVVKHAFEPLANPVPIIIRDHALPSVQAHLRSEIIVSEQTSYLLRKGLGVISNQYRMAITHNEPLRSERCADYRPPHGLSFKNLYPCSAANP